MRRRRFLEAVVFGAGVGFLSGCLEGDTPSSNSSAQSGSGNQCDNPRNIDYDAVDQYREHGVYLKNSDDTVHTACVTVTKEDQDREEEGPASPPPLRHVGYTIHPGRAVEIFTFDERGTYTIKVSIENTTKKEIFEKAEGDFADGKSSITTFEISSDSRIQLTPSKDLK